MTDFVRVWHSIWQVHSPVTLSIRASSESAMAAIIDASHPSQQRLQHRDLFVEGRRYYLRPRQKGFELRCDSKTPWNRKRRTARAAAVTATLDEQNGVTTLQLWARMRSLHLLLMLLFPSWMAVLVIAAPWSWQATLLIVTALYGLALSACRLDAGLQAHEMIFFIRKALEDFPQAEIAELNDTNPLVIDPVQQAFHAEWERFYRGTP